MKTSSQTIHGYAAKAKGQELVPFTYEPPNLGENDVRVSVTHCGLCYTDIHAIDDYFGITTYPFVPGHEIVGHVSDMGPAVTELKIGDRVGIGWQGHSCMQCEWCLKGEEHLCEDVANNGSWTPYGGFSSSVTVDSRFAYPLPHKMASEVAAVLLCAGITVYSPLRLYVTDSAQRVGVIGVGGLGHLAIQFAHALGCEVTAISSSPEKEERARALGATHFIVAKDKDKLRDLQFSFDLLMYTAHGQTDWTSLLLTLKNNGKLVMIGFSPVPVTFEPLDLIVHQQSITGSFIGSRTTMREMLSLAQTKGIRPKIELMPMKLVNEAIRKLKEDKPPYRIVLVNDGSAV
ncbi:MAG: NAD(P)-dependent alcohol dehydrogenase [Promethearchaeota archaeon]